MSHALSCRALCAGHPRAEAGGAVARVAQRAQPRLHFMGVPPHGGGPHAGAAGAGAAALIWCASPETGLIKQAHCPSHADARDQFISGMHGHYLPNAYSCVPAMALLPLQHIALPCWSASH